MEGARARLVNRREVLIVHSIGRPRKHPRSRPTLSPFKNSKRYREAFDFILWSSPVKPLLVRSGLVGGQPPKGRARQESVGAEQLVALMRPRI